MNEKMLRDTPLPIIEKLEFEREGCKLNKILDYHCYCIYKKWTQVLTYNLALLICFPFSVSRSMNFCYTFLNNSETFFSSLMLSHMNTISNFFLSNLMLIYIRKEALHVYFYPVMHSSF